MSDIKQMLIDCGAVKFGDFTLASGKKSRYYVDIKQASTNPETLEAIGKEMWLEMISRDIKADAVACVELGSIPIGVMVSHESYLPLIIIRKETKNHGIANRIIGNITKGMKIILVEDVTTTGGTIIKAVELLRETGTQVNEAISVVDRNEGATESLKTIGIRLTSLTSAKELLRESL